MGLSLQIDTAKYRNDINRLVARFEIDTGELLKEEARLFVRDVNRLTPPGSYSEGRNAVKRDINRVFRSVAWVIRELKVKAGDRRAALIFRKLIRAGNYEGARDMITQRSNIIENVPVRAHVRGGAQVKAYTQKRRKVDSVVSKVAPDVQFYPSVVPQVHKDNRNRYGHVPSKLAKGIIASAKSLRDYIKEIQSHVGWARAGWLPAARRYGYKMPQWIERFATAPGAVHENLGAGVSSPSITLINRGSALPGYQRIVDTALYNRYRSLGREALRILAGGKTRRGSFAGTSAAEPATPTSS